MKEQLLQYPQSREATQIASLAWVRMCILTCTPNPGDPSQDPSLDPHCPVSGGRWAGDRRDGARRAGQAAVRRLRAPGHQRHGALRGQHPPHERPQRAEDDHGQVRQIYALCKRSSLHAVYSSECDIYTCCVSNLHVLYKGSCNILRHGHCGACARLHGCRCIS